jgi:hypothetical protein
VKETKIGKAILKIFSKITSITHSTTQGSQQNHYEDTSDKELLLPNQQNPQLTQKSANFMPESNNPPTSKKEQAKQQFEDAVVNATQQPNDPPIQAIYEQALVNVKQHLPTKQVKELEYAVRLEQRPADANAEPWTKEELKILQKRAKEKEEKIERANSPTENKEETSTFSFDHRP